MKTITLPVGKYPAKNLIPDVRTVQQLLNSVGPANGGPDPPLAEHGFIDAPTIRAIEAFQFKHFGFRGTDGCVDPNGATLAKLNELSHGFASCNIVQVITLHNDYIKAGQYAGVALGRLQEAGNIAASSARIRDTRTKVRDVFGIDLAAAAGGGLDMVTQFLEMSRYSDLIIRFRKLHNGLLKTVPFVCEAGGTRGEVAWVRADNNHRDPTIHVEMLYWSYRPDQRSVVLVHERAHTVLNLHGHPSSLGPSFMPTCNLPHQGHELIRYPHSVENPWCYEWLTASLQPHYTAARFSRVEPCSESVTGSAA